MLNKINFTCTKARKQIDLFTPEHTKFNCIIKYNNEFYRFPYQCNTKYIQPTKENCIAAIILEAECSEMCADLADFLCKFGYTNGAEAVRKGKKAFEACELTNKAMHKMFTFEEFETLKSELEDYM